MRDQYQLRPERRAAKLTLPAVLLCLALSVALVACGDGGGKPATPSPVSAATPTGQVPGETGLGQEVDGRADKALDSVMVLPGSVVTLTRMLGDDRNPPEGEEELGPPDWVRPGTRITFNTAGGRVASAEFGLKEDDEATWEDMGDGKRYRLEESIGLAVPNTGETGLDQIDVVALEGTDVVGSVVHFIYEPITEAYMVGSSGGARVPGAVLTGVWTNPTQLQRLIETVPEDVRVLRGQYELGEKTYDALLLGTFTSGKALIYIYDLETGVLLHSSSLVIGNGSTGSQVTFSDLAQRREREIPGQGSENPGWLEKTKSLRYKGQYSLVSIFDPNTVFKRYSMEVSATFKIEAESWAYYETQTSVPELRKKPIVTKGVAWSAGLYWFDVAALKKMKAGQVLDEDPITGEKIVVQAISTVSGRKVVTISGEMPGIAYTLQYDQQSGVLSAYTTELPGTATSLQLQNRP